MTTSAWTDRFPRSFLYVPAVRPELFGKAASGAADAAVFDLEDAVPLSQKDRARDHVREFLRERASTSAPDAVQLWVRVSADALADDLPATVWPALSGVFLAKCSVAALDEMSELLDALEVDRGLAAGHVGVLGLVETADAVLGLSEIVRHPRLVTLGIGEADLLGELRVQRTSRSAAGIDALRMQVVLHCAAAGLRAPVAPTSTAIRDLDGFQTTTRELFELGFRSRTAIHPSQVPVIHSVLTPGPEEISAASDVVARFEAADRGVATDREGRLIDAAVVREAHETLSRRPQSH
jgi:citrate lyase subunit beta/citryl-CoA lyase